MTTYTKFFTTIFFVFISFIYCLGQDVEINSQAEMDAFDPSTTVINGNLLIDGLNSSDPVTNLNNLSNLTSISGNLGIQFNASLTNIDALSNLTSVGEDLSIKNNDILANIDGLLNLTSAGGHLRINNNASITNIDALSNLMSIGAGLYIDNNDALMNIDALSNLISISGNLHVQTNPALTNIDGLSSLTSVIGYLRVHNNASITSINGLSNLTYISGNVTIGSNAILTNIDGLSSLTSIGQGLNIQNNAVLTNVDGLSSLTSVAWSLTIQNNPALTNCCSIQNLLNTPGAIVGEIAVSNNPSECSSANEIINNSNCDTCSLTIDDIIVGDCNNNGTATDPSDDTYEISINASALNAGIAGTYTVDDGTNIYELFTYGEDETITLSADGNLYTLTFIDSDSFDCTNQIEVSQEPCSTSSTINLNGKPLNYSISPNPTNENFQIEITGNKEPLDIQIYNSIGQKIVEIEMIENTIINTSTWTKGVYFIIINNKNGKILEVEKLLKME